jgi:hypothetical protein
VLVLGVVGDGGDACIRRHVIVQSVLNRHGAGGSGGRLFGAFNLDPSIGS